MLLFLSLCHLFTVSFKLAHAWVSFKVLAALPHCATLFYPECNIRNYKELQWTFNIHSSIALLKYKVEIQPLNIIAESTFPEMLQICLLQSYC